MSSFKPSEKDLKAIKEVESQGIFKISSEDERLIKQLQEEDKKGHECQVCGSADEGVIQLPCKHWFHEKECLGMWIETKLKERVIEMACPDCKAVIPDPIVKQIIAVYKPTLWPKLLEFSVKIATDTDLYFECPN